MVKRNNGFYFWVQSNRNVRGAAVLKFILKLRLTDLEGKCGSDEDMHDSSAEFPAILASTNLEAV